jgi:hypothetical protein
LPVVRSVATAKRLPLVAARHRWQSVLHRRGSPPSRPRPERSPSAMGVGRFDAVDVSIPGGDPRGCRPPARPAGRRRAGDTADRGGHRAPVRPPGARARDGHD